MKLEKHQIFNDFYSLSEMLDDDIDLIVDMIDDVCRVTCIRGRGKGTKATRKKTLTRLYIERADYEKLADDVDMVLSLPIQEFNTVKRRLLWKRQASGVTHVQSTIFDFIGVW